MKPGFLTSEFTAFIASLIAAVIPQLQGNANPWVQIAGMVAATAYGAYRTHLKSLAQPGQPTSAEPITGN